MIRVLTRIILIIIPLCPALPADLFYTKLGTRFYAFSFSMDSQHARKDFRFSGSINRHGLHHESSMEAANLQKVKTSSLLLGSRRRFTRRKAQFDSENSLIEMLIRQLDDRQSAMMTTLLEIRSARIIQAAFRIWMGKKFSHRRRCRIFLATWYFYASVRWYRRMAAKKILLFYRAIRVRRVKIGFTRIVKALLTVRTFLRNLLLLKKARKEALIIAFATRRVDYVIGESTKTIMRALKDTWVAIVRARLFIGSKVFPCFVRHRRLLMLESERGLALFAVLSDKRTPTGQRKYRTGNQFLDDILKFAQEALERVEIQNVYAGSGGALSISLARRNQLRRYALKRASGLSEAKVSRKSKPAQQPGAEVRRRSQSPRPRVAAFIRDASASFTPFGDIPRELSGPFRLRTLYDVTCFVLGLLKVAKANPSLCNGSGQLQNITMQAMAIATSKQSGAGAPIKSGANVRSKIAVDPARVSIRLFLMKYYTGAHKFINIGLPVSGLQQQRQKQKQELQHVTDDESNWEHKQ